MSGERFLDTNVLVYAFSGDARRGPVAKELLIGGGMIGVQVLNEFTSVARQKLRWDWAHIAEALAILADLLDEPMPMTREVHARAVELARAHTLGFYDALIIAAASLAGCKTLLTEDLQHGRRIGDVLIRNPFLQAA